jgi:hypothetical protein
MSLYLINTTVYSFSMVTVAHMDEDRFKRPLGFDMSFVKDCVTQRDVELTRMVLHYGDSWRKRIVVNTGSSTLGGGKPVA